MVECGVATGSFQHCGRRAALYAISITPAARLEPSMKFEAGKKELAVQTGFPAWSLLLT